MDDEDTDDSEPAPHAEPRQEIHTHARCMHARTASHSHTCWTSLRKYGSLHACSLRTWLSRLRARSAHG